MAILGWILFGFVVGVMAKLLMPGRDPGGMVVTTLLGICGALVGGFLGRVLGWYGEGEPVGFLMAVMGALLVLFVFRKLSRPASGRSERRLMT
ncbi:MAG: GlsB/YeaQ/YmgE family stress response membrane protein [Nitrospirales bacterium]